MLPPPLRREVAERGGLIALLVVLGACSSEPRIPTTLTLSSTALSFSALGQTQQLSTSVTDQQGDPLPDASVTWSSSNDAVATVTPSGLVTAQGAGTAQVTATSGSANAAAEVSVVQTPTQLSKVSGDGQSATAGEALPAPLIVRVNDALGNPIPSVAVAFLVTQGEGSLSSSSVNTGSDGRASTSYTTGSIAGTPQMVSATVVGTAISVSFSATAAGDPGSFNIGLRFLSGASDAQRQAFTNARLRWESLITGDLDDVQLQAAAEDCGPGTPAIDQQIDDLVILVQLQAIDGPGGVLGGAGPCYIRVAGDLTILGVMEFDTDDLATLESDGLLANVIQHEMAHVLGFGTLWDIQGLLADPSLPPIGGASPDPHFTGARARTAFNTAGGTTYVGAKVPVEDMGGLGTQDSHWRESVFETELMTGFIAPGPSPLSLVTVESLADQGYAVNIAGADAYTLPTAGLRASGGGVRLKLGDDILRLPIKRIDRKGRVTGVLRR